MVHQDEDLRHVGAKVESDGRSLPIDFSGLAGFHAEHPAAVAQAYRHRAAGLFAFDVATGPAMLLESLLDDFAKTLSTGAEKPLRILQD